MDYCSTREHRPTFRERTQHMSGDARMAEFCKGMRRMREDREKLSNVTAWVNIDNPVIGTCRSCGSRGLISDPRIGFYSIGHVED